MASGVLIGIGVVLLCADLVAPRVPRPGPWPKVTSFAVIAYCLYLPVTYVFELPLAAGITVSGILTWWLAVALLTFDVLDGYLPPKRDAQLVVRSHT